MKKKLSVKKTVYTALFAAIVFVCTVVVHIHIPIPGAVDVAGVVVVMFAAVVVTGLSPLQDASAISATGG